MIASVHRPIPDAVQRPELWAAGNMGTIAREAGWAEHGGGLLLFEGISFVESKGDSQAQESRFGCWGLVQFKPSQKAVFDKKYPEITQKFGQLTVGVGAPPENSVIYGAYVFNDVMHTLNTRAERVNAHSQRPVHPEYKENQFLAVRGYYGGASRAYPHVRDSQSREYPGKVAAYLLYKADEFAESNPEKSADYSAQLARLYHDAQRVGQGENFRLSTIRQFNHYVACGDFEQHAGSKDVQALRGQTAQIGALFDRFSAEDPAAHKQPPRYEDLAFHQHSQEPIVVVVKGQRKNPVVQEADHVPAAHGDQKLQALAAMAMAEDQKYGGTHDLANVHWGITHGQDGRAMVAAIQQRLNALGFDCGKADGFFGKQTAAAYMQWEKAQSLQQDGYVTGKEVAMLIDPPASTPVVVASAKPTAERS